MYAAAISGKSKKTQAAYMQAVREFASRCKKTFLDEIKREDLLAYRDSINREPLTKHNKLARVVIWLNTEGIKRLLQADDWPEYEMPTPDSYDADEIARMMAAAGSEDRRLLQFFLTTGFRMGEVSHAEYGDIDYRNCTITTQPKPHWDWEPKKTSVKDRKKAKRTVRIPESLVLEIAERRETAEDPDGLIFPNGSGKPNMHLLRVVQHVAKAAGVEGRIGLHKFRRTFATRYAKKQGVKDAADMLGHKHLDQIMRYVAATKPESEEQRRHTEEVFSDVCSKPIMTFAAD
jgi:integrase